MFSAKRLALLGAGLVALAAASCSDGRVNPGDVRMPVIEPTMSRSVCQNQAYPPGAPQFRDHEAVEFTVSDSGLRFLDIRVGEGSSPQPGDTVKVNYTGWLPDDCVFDSTFLRQAPSEFDVGIGQVIPGWDEGLSTMRVGGERRLELPPDLAYGRIGVPGVIPANATLFFHVELLEIVQAETG